MSLLFEWLEDAVRTRTAATGSSHAVVFRDTYLSWHGLLHRVERRAREMATMGIRAGDFVGLMLGNDPEFVILALALSKLDAVVVPVDPTITSRDLDMTLAALPLRGIVARPKALDPFAAPAGALHLGGQARLARLAAESRHRISGTLLSCALYACQRPQLEPGVEPEVVLLTLDAGGDPKAVVRGPSQLRGIAATLGKVFDLGPDANVLCAAPLFDCQGFDLGFLAALPAAATLCLDETTAGPRLAKLLVGQAVGLLAATPREFAALARVANVKPLRGRNTRLLCSGVPLPPAVARAFRRRYGLPILSCYQSCEAGPCAVDLGGNHPESVGSPLPGIEVRVAGHHGEGLARGTVGPIWVRGAGVATTFLPALPVRSGQFALGRGLQDGWLRTGDLGYFDAGDRLHLSLREDDIVKVDRHCVALGEIESCLESHASVKAARARVEYDDSGSTHIVVRITPGNRCRPDAMLDHCVKRLAPHKVPRRIEFGD